MIGRRSFLLGLGAAVAAPAIIRSGILMPVKRVLLPEIGNGVALTSMPHPSWHVAFEKIYIGDVLAQGSNGAVRLARGYYDRIIGVAVTMAQPGENVAMVAGGDFRPQYTARPHVIRNEPTAHPTGT